jgi:hypothetical protein
MQVSQDTQLEKKNYCKEDKLVPPIALTFFFNSADFFFKNSIEVCADCFFFLRQRGQTSIDTY